jgi:hypothetical protein
MHHWRVNGAVALVETTLHELFLISDDMMITYTTTYYYTQLRVRSKRIVQFISSSSSSNYVVCMLY